MSDMNLDLKDRKLLFLLEQDARRTNTSLAKEVGLVPDVVQYRIDRLLNRGILKSFLGYINFAKLGYVAYGLYLSTQRMTSAQEQSFVEFLNSHPCCTYFCRTGGTYDYVADMLARNPIALVGLINEISNAFSNFLYRQEIITRIYMTHFPKQYLLDAAIPPSPSTYFGGLIDEQVKIDEVDDSILRILASNARVKMVDIAEQVGLSDTAIGLRRKRMEDAKLITGYFALIEPQSFGYQMFNLLLKLQNFRDVDEEQLFEFCRMHRHVTWFIKTLGLWDFEIAVEVKSQQELQKVVYELKNQFSGIIQRIEFAPIFQTIKYSQYPFSKELHMWS